MRIESALDSPMNETGFAQRRLVNTTSSLYSVVTPIVVAITHWHLIGFTRYSHGCAAKRTIATRV